MPKKKLAQQQLKHPISKKKLDQKIHSPPFCWGKFLRTSPQVLTENPQEKPSPGPAWAPTEVMNPRTATKRSRQTEGFLSKRGKGEIAVIFVLKETDVYINVYIYIHISI